MRIRRRMAFTVHLGHFTHTHYYSSDADLLQDAAGSCWIMALSMRFALAYVIQSDYRERILKPFLLLMGWWPMADSAWGEMSGPLPLEYLSVPVVGTFITESDNYICRASPSPPRHVNLASSAL